MDTESSTPVDEVSEEQGSASESGQNDTEKSISTVSEEKVNERDTVPTPDLSTGTHMWINYVPGSPEEIPKTLEGRLSFSIDGLNDWLIMKEKLRLTTVLKNLHKSYASAYVNRWVLESNALLRTITRLKHRRDKITKK